MGLFQGTAAGTKNKLPGLITSMETTGAKALEEFADNIKVEFSSMFSLARPTDLEEGVSEQFNFLLSMRPHHLLVKRDQAGLCLLVCLDG